MDWLPEAMRILHDELPNMEVTVSSQYSPQLADALTRGKLDVAFMRPEAQTPDLAYRLITRSRWSPSCRAIIVSPRAMP